MKNGLKIAGGIISSVGAGVFLSWLLITFLGSASGISLFDIKQYIQNNEDSTFFIIVMALVAILVLSLFVSLIVLNIRIASKEYNRRRVIKGIIFNSIVLVLSLMCVILEFAGILSFFALNIILLIVSIVMTIDDCGCFVVMKNVLLGILSTQNQGKNDCE